VPGYDWTRPGLARRAPGAGVEAVEGDTYRRTIAMAGAPAAGGLPGRESCLLLRLHLPYWEGLIHV